jgi:hypothetical protein
MGQCHKKTCVEQARPDSKFCTEHSCAFELSNGAICHGLGNGRIMLGEVPSALEQYGPKWGDVWISFDLCQFHVDELIE